ncbi:MAG TPA: hypothetical protein VFC78_07780 [Tepidisphaeraceae bacterium]|nr:hypothetical protein [Tepidisphaeraceae bacterium]
MSSKPFLDYANGLRARKPRPGTRRQFAFVMIAMFVYFCAIGIAIMLGAQGGPLATFACLTLAIVSVLAACVIVMRFVLQIK